MPPTADPSTFKSQLNLLVKERKHFLFRELDYFERICQECSTHVTSAGVTDSFYEHGEIWIEAVRKYLTHTLMSESDPNVLRNHIDAELSEDVLLNDKYRHQVYSRYVTRFSRMAQLFQHVTVQHVARQKKNLRAQVSPTEGALSLSEIHPDFAESIRSIEAINNFCHDKVMPFLERFEKSIPPVLAVSTDERFELEYFPSNNFYQDVIETVPKYQYREVLAQRLILSWIKVPRWFPNQLRYSPILAHEHFHRVIWLVTQVADAIGQVEGTRDERNTLDLMPSRYGNHVTALYRYYLKLVKSLDEVLHPRRAGTAYLGTESPPLSVDACRWVTELLADIFSFVLFGPAGSWSLLYQIERLQLEERLLSRPKQQASHPPSFLRVYLQMYLLNSREWGDLSRKYVKCYYDALGATHRKSGLDTIGLDDEDRTRLESRAKDGRKRSTSPHDRLKKWLAREFETVVDVCDLVSTVTGDTLWKRLDDDNEELARQKAGQWLEHVNKLSRKVENGELIFDPEEPLENLLNAMWLSVLSIEDPRCYTAWRLILERRLYN